MIKPKTIPLPKALTELRSGTTKLNKAAKLKKQKPTYAQQLELLAANQAKLERQFIQAHRKGRSMKALRLAELIARTKASYTALRLTAVQADVTRTIVDARHKGAIALDVTRPSASGPRQGTIWRDQAMLPGDDGGKPVPKPVPLAVDAIKGGGRGRSLDSLKDRHEALALAEEAKAWMEKKGGTKRKD